MAPADVQASLTSVLISRARCEDYAEKARAKDQHQLADVYENFLLLLREYGEDLDAGIVGRVLISL